MNKENPSDKNESISEKKTLKPSLQQPPITEGELGSSDSKLVLNSLPDWVWEVDTNSFITFSNTAVEKVLGYTPDELQERSLFHMVPRDDSTNARKLLTQSWEQMADGEYVTHYFTSKDQKQVLFETRGTEFFDSRQNKNGIRFVSRPVAKNKSDDLVDMKTDVYAANHINAAIAIISPDMVITYVNEPFTNLFGYSKEEIVGQPLSILGTDGNSDEFQPQDVGFVLQNQEVWHGEVQRRTKNGRYISCLLSARAARDDDGNFTGFIGTYFDMRPIKYAGLKIQNSLKEIISTVCNAIEDRNVIKSKHQERVTDLAQAIAIEMGKDKHFIDGLTLAAMLHDLGEMYIPVEIATRTGELSESDMDLIKTHPKKGYEIVKKANLPWPVADIILQHHERMDGSGYPNHLQGDEIMMEARILGVSDVVETMLTNRPYRQACTLGECVNELEKNKGILYDPRVVDICLKLIREKNYFLKQI